MTIDELDAIVVEAIALKGVIQPICNTYKNFYLSKGLSEDSLGECYLYYKISLINYDKLEGTYWPKSVYIQEVKELTSFIKAGQSIFKECPIND